MEQRLFQIRLCLLPFRKCGPRRINNRHIFLRRGPLHRRAVFGVDFKRVLKGGDRLIQTRDGVLPALTRPKGLKGKAKVVLRAGPIHRRGVFGSDLKRVLKGCDRLIQPRDALFPALLPPKGSKGNDKVLLRHGPLHRRGVFGIDLKGAILCFYGVFK